MNGILIKTVSGSWRVRHMEMYPSPLRGFKITEYPVYPFIDDETVKELADTEFEFDIIELEVNGFGYEFAKLVKP